MIISSGSYDVAIVGAGLTGLTIAYKLERLGFSVCLLESRARVGGRIHSAVHNARVFDLGPAWFWGAQPLMAKLSNDLGLRVFQQHSVGDMLYQDASGRQIVRRAMSMMEGANRIDGGMSALTDGLLEKLSVTVKLNCHASELLGDASGYQIGYRQKNRTIESAKINRQDPSVDQSIAARIVVFAMPPRLIASSIKTHKLLSQSQLDVMRAIPTWMAGHAKVIAVYDRPFWRDNNLSGDAVSHHGPLVQIHDASPYDLKQGALFGFVGIPASERHGTADELLASAQRQLATLFGSNAETGSKEAVPVKMWLQDWAEQTETATVEDANSPPSHPAYGMPSSLQGIENDTLILAATELVSTNGGLLEGALESAEDTVVRIARTLKK